MSQMNQLEKKKSKVYYKLSRYHNRLFSVFEPFYLPSKFYLPSSVMLSMEKVVVELILSRVVELI